MERNNLLVRKIMLLTVSGFLTMLMSCSKLPPLMMKDLVGRWESNKNEVLILYADSSFEAKNIEISENSAKFVFGDVSEIRIGGKGTWDIYKNKLCLHYLSFVKKNETIEKKYGFYTSVIGSGLFENRLPWKIVSWMGDVEEFNTFRKIK